MSNEWKINNDGENLISAIFDTCTLGLLSGRSKIYEVEDTDSGEIKHVRAFSEEEVGKKIAEGDFEDED